MADETDLTLLDPGRTRLLRAGGVPRMTLADDRSYVRVQLARAFPISNPNHYYAVLDGDGKDVGIIANPSELDADSHAIALDELDKRYFVPVVRKVIEAREDYGAIIWDVETDRGRNRYIVRSMRDNLAELSAQRVIITDVDGNRFEIPDITQLPPKALEIVMRNL